MRIDHVNLVVRDLDSAVRFYQEAFGLSVVLDCPLDGDWIETVMDRPGVTADCVILAHQDRSLRIELLRFPDPPADVGNRAAGFDAPGLRHVAVAVDDIDSVRARALAAGATAVGPVVEVPRRILPRGKRMCYLRDPEGVILELAQYGAG